MIERRSCRFFTVLKENVEAHELKSGLREQKTEKTKRIIPALSASWDSYD
jgi:hypothetical protein